VANVLFMVTGKTDNNMKCQFPLFLRQEMNMTSMPTVINGRLEQKPIPRVLQTGSMMKIIATLTNYPPIQQKLLNIYFSQILSDEEYVKQLWSIGRSYISLKECNSEKSLVRSLAVFKSRGSITAIKGHSPEQTLREHMREWGMIENLDYNNQDIAVGDIIGEIDVDKTIKKRKYDFILPYNSKTDGAKLFIQCQFYAGDSGSVSHKNVDRTAGTY
jgi:hypothetical protein